MEAATTIEGGGALPPASAMPTTSTSAWVPPGTAIE